MQDIMLKLMQMESYIQKQHKGQNSKTIKQQKIIKMKNTDFIPIAIIIVWLISVFIIKFLEN